MHKFRSLHHLILSITLLTILLTCNTTEPIVRQESTQGKTVEAIVAAMTLEEKIGQMTQAGRRYLISENDIRDYHLGSLLSGGGSAPDENSPAAWADMLDRYQSKASETRFAIPLLYGIDAVHGNNNVYGATIIPHNIGLGATGNPELARELAEMTAREVRAIGVNWTFAPCVANSRDERWGRAYESYGEDPVLISSLGAAQVRGYQGADLSDSESILACTKHYIGDGAPTWGTGEDGKIDRGDAQITEAELRALHLPPYVSAIDAGTGTIMASYNSWQGEKLHGHDRLMNGVLKDELGFEGFIVSDWSGIDELPGDYKSDIIQSINAGMDMVMVPGNKRSGYGYRTFIELAIEAVEEGSIPMSRIDDAVMRILRVKQEMGLLDTPFNNDRSLLPSVGSDAHREIARQAVSESVVLLKNEGVLPLGKDLASVVVAGRGANDVGMQCGGWSISWQGNMGDITPGTTILEGVQEVVSSSTEVSYSPQADDLEGADVVIVVIGEEPYAEMHGDRADLSLSNDDRELVQRASESGVPVVTILLSGRPLILGDVLAQSDALAAAWLPGTEGDGITDVLFGEAPATGKLPVSWPASMDQIPVNLGDADYSPLFPVGYGLSY